MFHRHKYEDVSCTYTSSTLKSFKNFEMSEHLMEKLTFGITNIVQRCTKCKKISSHQFIGDSMMDLH